MQAATVETRVRVEGLPLNKGCQAILWFVHEYIQQPDRSPVIQKLAKAHFVQAAVF